LYILSVFVVLIPCYLNELIILEQMFENQKVYTGQSPVRVHFYF